MNDFYRLVYCSRRKDRVTEVVILLSRTGGYVERVQDRGAGYDRIMHRLAQEDEHPAATIPQSAIDWSNYHCAHCGQESFIICEECGSYFCYNGQENTVNCPQCGTFFTRDKLVKAETIDTSTYGTIGEKPEVKRQKRLEALKRAADLLPDIKKDRKRLTSSR